MPVVLMRRSDAGVSARSCSIAPTMAGAQVRPDSARPPVPQDTAARPVIRTAEDSARDARAQARIDSLYRAKLADTIKAPLSAHFERPDQPELSTRLRFSREQILSSGAVNIADILERVPGVMTFRTGWLAGSHTANFNGDFSRVRIFLDGVERDAVEARNGGVLDLDDVPLWGLDEIMVERVAGEVRVWLKSWTVRRTTPYSRVDIFTGDLNTNGFRGLLARRFGNGFSLQLTRTATGDADGTRVGLLDGGGRRPEPVTAISSCLRAALAGRAENSPSTCTAPRTHAIAIRRRHAKASPISPRSRDHGERPMAALPTATRRGLGRKRWWASCAPNSRGLRGRSSIRR